MLIIDQNTSHGKFKDKISQEYYAQTESFGNKIKQVCNSLQVFTSK